MTIRENFAKAYPVEISGRALTIPAAMAMASLLSSGTYNGASLLACRTGDGKRPGAEVLHIEVDVGLGQKAPVHAIRAHPSK